MHTNENQSSGLHPLKGADGSKTDGYGKVQGQKSLMAMFLKSRCSSPKSELGPCCLNEPMFCRAWNEGPVELLVRAGQQTSGDVLRANSHGGVGVLVPGLHAAGRFRRARARAQLGGQRSERYGKDGAQIMAPINRRSSSG